MYIDEILCISSFKSRKILLQMLDNFITNVTDQSQLLCMSIDIFTRMCTYSKYCIYLLKKCPLLNNCPPCPFILLASLMRHKPNHFIHDDGFAESLDLTKVFASSTTFSVKKRLKIRQTSIVSFYFTFHDFSSSVHRMTKVFIFTISSKQVRE